MLKCMQCKGRKFAASKNLLLHIKVQHPELWQRLIAEIKKESKDG